MILQFRSAIIIAFSVWCGVVCRETSDSLAPEAGEVACLSIYLFASWQRPASSGEYMYIEAKMPGGPCLAIARMLHGK